MKLHCPHCGVKGSAEDSYIGRKVKCPKCQGVFEVLSNMTSEASADASFPATLSPPPGEIPSSVPEVDIAVAVGDDVAEIESETETMTVADAALGGEEAESLDERSEEVTEPEPVIPPAAEQEETLDWEDIGSEIDLQLAEATMGEEQEGSLPDGSAALSSFEEDFEKPVDEFGLLEEFSPLDADDVESPAGQKDNEQGETVVAESSEEDMLDEGVEREPYGIDKEKCWQCGKEEDVGQTFVAKDGRLYCPDCLSVENRKVNTDPEQEPVPHETLNSERPDDNGKGLSNDAAGGYDDEKPMGNSIYRAWAKARDALARWFGK
ncbi:zinc ribbon domain-containing protein [Desulfocastanea catecholica]